MNKDGIPSPPDTHKHTQGFDSYRKRLQWLELYSHLCLMTSPQDVFSRAGHWQASHSSAEPDTSSHGQVIPWPPVLSESGLGWQAPVSRAEDPSRLPHCVFFHLHLCWLSGVTQHGLLPPLTAAKSHVPPLLPPQSPTPNLVGLGLDLSLSASLCLFLSFSFSFLFIPFCLFLFIGLSSPLLSLDPLPFHQVALPSPLSLGVGCCSHGATAHCFPAVSPFRTLPKAALAGSGHVAWILFGPALLI